MLTVWIPVCMAIIHRKNLNRILILLAWFLSFSFLFDVKHFFLFLTPYRAHFYVSFGLFQLLFYIWFMWKLSSRAITIRYRTIVTISFIGLWFACYMPLIFGHDVLWQRSIFNVTQAMFLALMSAYALLELTKKELPLFHHPHFWFLLGIFLYFFMNIFLYAFMHAAFRDKIWPLHSIFDIIKNLLFAVGFFVAARHPNKK